MMNLSKRFFNVFSFYRIKKTDNEIFSKLLSIPNLYFCDPATTIAVSMLFPERNSTILDLCSVPGEKSLAIKELFPEAFVVASDFFFPTAENYNCEFCKMQL